MDHRRQSKQSEHVQKHLKLEEAMIVNMRGDDQELNCPKGAKVVYK